MVLMTTAGPVGTTTGLNLTALGFNLSMFGTTTEPPAAALLQERAAGLRHHNPAAAAALLHEESDTLAKPLVFLETYMETYSQDVCNCPCAQQGAEMASEENMVQEGQKALEERLEKSHHPAPPAHTPPPPPPPPGMPPPPPRRPGAFLRMGSHVKQRPQAPPPISQIDRGADLDEDQTGTPDLDGDGAPLQGSDADAAALAGAPDDDDDGPDDGDGGSDDA